MTPLERKGLLVSKGVQMKEIAEEVGCSKARISEVVYGKTVFETPMTRKVRAAIARRVDKSIEELWPDLGGVAA